MLIHQDIREIVRLTADTTVLGLSRILDWTPARTQKALYLGGGGILSNDSPVDFKAARLLIRQVGREAALGNPSVRLYNTKGPEDKPVGQPVFWKQRIIHWLSAAVEDFILTGRLQLETAVVFTDMAVTQLILGAIYSPYASDESSLAMEGETPRFEWREILTQFSLPSGEKLDAIETAFLNDLHAARNDIIHNLAPFILNRDSVYIWLFLALSLAEQWGASPELNSQGLMHFLPALKTADETARQGCVAWLNDFIPSLLGSALEGPIQVQNNLDGNLGISDDLGQAFIPDLIITDKDGLRYSAQVEIPATLNATTAQWWGHYQPSLVFVPFGYLAHARFLAKLSNYPEDRLMPYISPALANDRLPAAG